MASDHPLPQRIDVHSHFLPPDYSHALATNGHEKVDGMPGIPPWTLEDHLHMMKTANVSKSILSISSPGTHIVPGKDELGRNLTRHCNSYAADLKSRFPDKFGFWAALPLPDVDAALKEIDIAIEEGADGFGLLTNYHGRYLGSKHLDPVFERLNSVGATVFIHPTKPCIHHVGSSGLSSEETTDALPLGDEFPVPVFEFLFDTARAVINLFVSGTVAKYPNITYIIPHVGGCLPPLWTRFVQFSHVVPGGTKIDVQDARRTLETRFFFDIAGFIFDGSEGAQGQLKSFVQGLQISHDRLLYGSDFPFTRTNFVKEFADKMKSGLEELFTEEERQAIYQGNAVKLLEAKGLQKSNL
jgi:predicted TIM-barrel fold metal-dependent hydrolase